MRHLLLLGIVFLTFHINQSVPDFCLLEPDPGEGTEFILAHYYDHTNDRCTPFLYKGAKGNANRFENEKECIRNCSARAEEIYPMNATKVCTFNKLSGGCESNYLRYYYDSVYDKCRRFLWSGCHGNGNRFRDYDSCIATCDPIHEDGDDTEPDIPNDFCLLEPDPGEGTEFIVAVYYDHTKDQCTPFLYKGAKGNANRFENEKECIRNCSARAEEIYPMNATKVCTFNKLSGGCESNYLRYYYDSVYDKCRRFLWSGCHGNGNRFRDYDSCIATCDPIHEDGDDTEPDTPNDFCLLEPDPGEGTEFIVAVYYDHTKDQCTPFLYKGAKGNANRFENEKQCIRNCSARAEEIYPMNATKVCTFNKLSGGCESNYLRYYYDSVYDKCRRFLWSGCHGNGNRFRDYDSCIATCDPIHEDGDDTEPDIPNDFCLLEPDPGEGTEFIVAVYYDHTKDQCTPFLYKGAKGNANRFENEKQCIRNCSARAEEIYPMNATKACTFNKLSGGCESNYLRYYYDSVYDKCRKFFWSGCHGNGNRFRDYDSCIATCDPIHEDGDDTEPDTPNDFCLLEPDPGEGTEFIVAVYYDHTKDQCTPFLYKGAKGNANRFENEKQCIRNCSARAEEIYPMNATKVCTFNKLSGGCESNYLRYYYDSVYDKCRRFLWSGCHGNGNRFRDYDSCIATCDPIHEDGDDTEPDIPNDFCLLEPDPGEGTEFIVAVYYDHTKDQCTPFLYKGAKGNANRFENEKQCIRNCSARAEEIYPMNATKACTFNKLSGGCESNYLRYYYDSVYDKCRKFFWSGCHGNGNRFRDYDSCIATCDPIHEDGDEMVEDEQFSPTDQ